MFASLEAPVLLNLPVLESNALTISRVVIFVASLLELSGLKLDFASSISEHAGLELYFPFWQER